MSGRRDRFPATTRWAASGQRWLAPLVVVALLAGALPLAVPASAPAALQPPAGPQAAEALAHLSGLPPQDARPVEPSVTGLFDWDPQPFILPPSFPEVSVAGEGAVMTTSDLYGTVVLFGGEGPSGLTNLTITVNETTALWKVSPQPAGPSPRANASFVTVDRGRYGVLFGGVVNLTSGAPDNQTWVFDFRNLTWTNVTGPMAPPARESAAMASDPRSSEAVLEGGWNPSYSVGGAGASIIWNDTWILNTTNFTWTRAPLGNAPRPSFGASMVYDPVGRQYLLFGGCASSCTNNLYGYVPYGNWSRLSETGDVPAPRGGASEVYASTWNVTMLSGGFQFGGNSLQPLNDSFLYTPASHTWDLIASPLPVPSPRFGSAAAFLAANHCPGMFLVGGSSAVAQPPPDGWFLDSNPDYGSGCNNWGGDQVGGGGGGGQTNCTPVTYLNVSVRNIAGGAPIANATVQITGACGILAGRTGAAGVVNFTGLPNETLRVLTLGADYHSNLTFVNLSQPGRSHLTVLLTALPSVHVQVWGDRYPNRIIPVNNASVLLAPSLPLGSTDSYGWYNDSGFAGPQGPNTFLADAVGYSNGSETVNIPYTGSVIFAITLFAYGAFDVHVLESPDGTPIAGATGVIAPVGAYAYGGPIDYTTNASGWFNTTLPQTNYSVTADAPGFQSNTTRGPVAHVWVLPSIVTLNLSLEHGAAVNVRLVDAVTHRPIGGGTVHVGYFPAGTTSPSGWANFTNIAPPGWYDIQGSAPNYRGNSTAVDLTYLLLSPSVYLNLTPLPGCGNHCVSSLNGSNGPFHLLPSDAAALDAFVLAPVLLVLAGIVYALYVRRRGEAPS